MRAIWLRSGRNGGNRLAMIPTVWAFRIAERIAGERID
jgi:hypothetical protein